MAIQPERPPGNSGSNQRVGADLLATIRAELADERARKDSIESRALTLAAASAAAIALIFGLGADYVGRWHIVFFILLGLAGLLFLGASALGWWSVRFLSYEQPKLSELRRLVDEGGDPDVDDLDLYIADGLMTSLESARVNNDGKVRTVERAFGAFLIGAAVVAVELMLVVADKILG